MKKLCLLFSLIFLSSCSDFYQQFDQTDLHQLVGQSQSEVTKKLGTPTYTLIDEEETKPSIDSSTHRSKASRRL